MSLAIMQDVTSHQSAAAFNAIMDALKTVRGIDRPATIAGLLSVLAVQIKGHMLTTDELKAFTADANQWAVCYLLADGEMQ